MLPDGDRLQSITKGEKVCIILVVVYSTSERFFKITYRSNNGVKVEILAFFTIDKNVTSRF